MKKFDGYMYGIDFGGWLSQCEYKKEHYDTFITPEDFKVVKDWGLDHIRIPVDYELFEDNNEGYIEDGFKYLDLAIRECEKNDLNMILDLHKTYGYSFDENHGEKGFFETPAYQERFYRLWEEFAKRYGKYSDRMCFELLNEVTKKEYNDIWNEVARKCVERIRVYAPDMRIIFGGYFNNSIKALKDLAMPFDDKIVYTFHCYEPLIFTHQGAYWISTMDTSFRMPFESKYKDYDKYIDAQLGIYFEKMNGFDPEAVIGIEYFEKLIDEAVRVAEERDVPLYCGEFGVIDLASCEDALKWYRMICKCFDKHGIARSAWNYKLMDFGITDDHMKPVVDGVIDAIAGRQ